MDKVKLMDRVDTKYIFHIDNLECVFEKLLLHYDVVEINSTRISRYNTLYYDTKELLLYYHHHNGKPNRYKIRHRTYVDSNLSFLEIKYKNSKQRTLKNRIKETSTSPLEWNEHTKAFLQNHTPYKLEQLCPTVWVNYSRITFVNKTDRERVTIDVNLEFASETVVKNIHELIIAEVKQDKASKSFFVNTMKELHLREGGISKYCMAIAYTQPLVKKNLFKPKLLTIQKIIRYGIPANS